MIKNLKLRLAETGKIKIGKKGEERISQKGTKYRLPEKTEFFTVTTLERDENGDFKPDKEIMDLYGEEPTNLDIKLLFDDVDLNFPTQYALYSGSKCLCSGDGETATQIDWQTGETKDIECNPDKCPNYQSNKCKVSGILNCILTRSTRIGGVYKFRTHSINSVVNILSSLKFIWTLTGGKLAMIPLTLTLRPKHVTPEKSNAGITVYIANIEYNGNSSGLLDDAISVAKSMLARNADMKQIQMKAKELEHGDGITAAEIVQEFYPKSQEGYEDTEIQAAEVTEIIEAGSTIVPLKEEEMQDAKKDEVNQDDSKALHNKIKNCYLNLMKWFPDDYTNKYIKKNNYNFLGTENSRECNDINKLQDLLNQLQDVCDKYEKETKKQGELL